MRELASRSQKPEVRSQKLQELQELQELQDALGRAKSSPYPERLD
jgi:hypothetical protein